MENYGYDYQDYEYYDENPSGQGHGQGQGQGHDDAMHIDFDPGMQSWPWTPALTPGPGQGQNQTRQLDYGNPFLIPGYDYDYNLDEGVLHQPQAQPQSPQPPPPAAVPPTPAAPPPPRPIRPGPAPKVAIPRSKSSESASYRRRRSARACEPCRQRKIKCDGDKPVCRQCVENQISCAYLDIKRVREQKQLGVLGRRVEAYKALLREIEPDVGAGAARRIRRVLKDEEEEHGSESDSSISSIGSLDAIDLVEEDLNRNEQTRATGYIGKNSEVSWMQKLESEAKHRSHRTPDDTPALNRDHQRYGDQQASDVSIMQMSYHLDDLDLPMFESVDPYAVPDREQADRFLAAYMAAFHPSFNAIREKTFTTQYRQFYRQLGSAKRPPRKWLAVLNMVFAIGCYYCHLTGEHTGEDEDVFMARARKLGLSETALFEHSDLQQIQVEFLVAFYLLARDQVNRASKFSNMAFRSALSLGINLRFVDEQTHYTAKEARSRLWWSVYTLEHSIAGLTGRVSCASEGFSSVPMPIPYDEDGFEDPAVLNLFQDITLRQIVLKPTLFQSDDDSRSHGTWLEKCPPSPSLYFYCLVDLVFITQAIIGKVYSIEGIRERSGQIEQRIRKYGIKLDNWLAKVPSAYRFTSAGGREALSDFNLFSGSGVDRHDDPEGGDSDHKRERFSLAMHFYSAKITLCRPCLTHSNARTEPPCPSTATTAAATTGNTGTACNSSNISSHRSRFRTEMSLSCLRASCALVSLLPNEPDVISLTRLSPWWHHLHYLVQATTALLLGLARWPTSPPAEEKPPPPPPPTNTGTGTGTSTSTSSDTANIGPNINMNMNVNGNPAPTPTLPVATVIGATKKALRWLYAMGCAREGENAARRAFALCDSFMRRIAPTVGVDVSDLPEVAGLPGLDGRNDGGGGVGEKEEGRDEKGDAGAGVVGE